MKSTGLEQLVNHASMALDLQLFAEPAAGSEGDKQEDKQSGATSTAPEIDYEKLASVIEGKKSVAEDTVLKNYFKQQGLSQDEMKAAIATYKQQKAESEPDANVLQQNLQQQSKLLVQSQIENVAILEAMGLGLDQKTIPYVIKMADLSNAVVDGKVDNEAVNKAISKVLEDIPQLKPEQQTSSGLRIGAGNSLDKPKEDQQDQLAKIFGNAR